ncbi:MAG: hypothetical protein QOE15_3413, partial [Acidimicrobiaceae bacterium]|nr:hypothetical protein [Acidimicrobiaceae bacterium]
MVLVANDGDAGDAGEAARDPSGAGDAGEAAPDPSGGGDHGGGAAQVLPAAVRCANRFLAGCNWV